MLSIFDGHHGGSTSGGLWIQLSALVVDVLRRLHEDFNNTSEFQTLSSDGTIRWRDPPAQDIDDAIKHAFLSWDHYIVHHLCEDALSASKSSLTPTALAFWNLLYAWAGSTALLAWYDNQTRQLRVACTGTSRAVLGRRTKDSQGRRTYEVHVLSDDHTPSNPAEVARLTAQHPGEPLFEEDGRFLGGMRTTRAFGDAHLKLDRAVLEHIRDELHGPPVLDCVKTPPYLTAEPVVTTTHIQPGDFLVMATDGLWEWLTSAEAVGLVGLWIDGARIGYDRPLPREALPASMDEDGTALYKRWGAEKRFVNVDGNVATHLARNALGAANIDMAAALLSLRAPQARRYRWANSLWAVSLLLRM